MDIIAEFVHQFNELARIDYHDEFIKWKHFPRYWPFMRGIRWIPLTRAGDAELWWFLWAAPEQTIEQTIEMRVNWNTIAVIMTSL